VKTLLITTIFLSLLTQAFAEFYSTEDETRFRSEPYKKAAAGMLAPEAYVERAKKALLGKYPDLRMGAFEAPWVARRFYADAPKADQDIICVSFASKELVKPPIDAGKRLPNPQFMARPIVLVLMRKDLSKIYVNEVFHQVW